VGTCALMLLATGCGRNGMRTRDGSTSEDQSAEAPPTLVDGAHDWPSDPQGSADGPPPRDSLPEVASADIASDVTAGPDLPPRDAGPADVAGTDVASEAAATFDLPPTGCPAPSNNGVLNLGHIKQALFAPDGRSLLVRIGAADTDTRDDARLIYLPDGASRVLGSGARNVEWLGSSRALLTTAEGLVAVSLDGQVLRSLATQTCNHAATPDGSRIYYASECNSLVSGALGVLDLATGTSQPLATNASPSSLVVSPDSRWAAYLVYTGDPSSSTRVVHVADATGSTYAITGPASATRPVFVSGEILLFQAPATRPPESAVWRHELGTGNSRSLTEGDLAMGGYEIAGDGSALVVAGFPTGGRTGELSLVPLDGGSPVRLASDLMDYRMYSMPVRPFAFAPYSRRVVYVADQASDAGRVYGISTASGDGSEQVELPAAGGTAVVSPYADRVAVIAVDRTLGRSTVGVVSASGARQLAIEVAGEVSFASFVPRDRGLLFIRTSEDKVLGTTRELRHLSFASGNVTVLAWWRTSTLALPNQPVGIASYEYPVDPTGCYAVVDSDMDSTASRLVALPNG
jgi:hypothetical protein